MWSVKRGKRMKKDEIKQHKEKIMAKLNTGLVKLKKGTDFMAVIGVFYILLFQIKALRTIGKGVCQYLISCGIPVDLAFFKSLYFDIEVFFKAVILVWISLSVILFLARMIWDQKLKKETGNTRFEEGMFRYLQDTDVSRCFLVTGKWGSGKTYEVKQFFDKYYRYSNTEVYRVSCFGLSSRKDLVEEINQTIEKGDTSFYALMIRVLQFLPVIGAAIEKFLKKSYTYTSVKKGSIFIFDDFERLTSRTIADKHVAHIYHRSPTSRSRASSTREFDDIKKEFQSVERSFLKVEDFIDQNARREDYDKYIAVTGLINEMIESYGVKVIIVCNSDILGEKFLHDVLRSKLNCAEYRKTITPEIRGSVLKQMLECRVFDDTEKRERITQFLNSAETGLADVMRNEVFKDLRLFRSLLEAFTDTAMLFEKEALTDGFLYSLFNSIMLTHLCYYGNSVQRLERFVNGANLKFLVFLFFPSTGMPDPVWLSGGGDEMKWVDVSVSGYWILNMSMPDQTSAIWKEWEQYPYSGLEREMLQNAESLESRTEAGDYNLLHILFYQKQLEKKDAGYWLQEDCMEKVMKVYDLSQTDVVQDILDMVDGVLEGRIHTRFQSKLFQVLSEGGSGKSVEEATYLHEQYNRFLAGIEE